MKLNNHEFTAAAFIIESENGYRHNDYEREIISCSTIGNLTGLELKHIIINGLENNVYSETELRTSAYWALSKFSDFELIKNFRNWLKIELEKNEAIPVFQILIALDRLDEPVFPEFKKSRDSSEFEENKKFAEEYLSKF